MAAIWLNSSASRRAASASAARRLADSLLSERKSGATHGGEMIFTKTNLKGAYIVDIERREDNRGFFTRMFCQKEFEAFGLKPIIAQANLASNRKKGTMRGMHFQYPPVAETKFVRCTRGAILDIIVDLRPESATYLEHVAVELSADNQRGLYVPERFAHGYQVLCDDTDTSYQVGEFYAPGLESGLRYDDPRLRLPWPLPVTAISDKDREWRPLDVVESELRERMRVGATDLAGMVR
jgi:dTDP-4-dehydrorhamnose 3,5-epimerase